MLPFIGACHALVVNWSLHTGMILRRLGVKACVISEPTCPIHVPLVWFHITPNTLSEPDFEAFLFSCLFVVVQLRYRARHSDAFIYTTQSDSSLYDAAKATRCHIISKAQAQYKKLNKARTKERIEQ